MHLIDQCFENADMEQTVSFHQWQTQDGKTQKLSVTATLQEAKENLQAQLKPFARHVHDARRQHREMKLLKETLAPGEIIIHEDFSENYALTQQREIMEAH